MILPPRVRGSSIASDTPFAYDFAAIVRQRGTQLFAYSREGRLLAKGVAGQDDENVLSAAMDELTKGRSWYERLVIAAHLKLTKFPTIEQDYTIIDCQGVLERSSPQNDEFITIRNCNNVIWRGGEIFEPYALNSPSLGLFYAVSVYNLSISNVYLHDGVNANMYIRNCDAYFIYECIAKSMMLASGASDDTGSIVTKGGWGVIHATLSGGAVTDRGIYTEGQTIIAECNVYGMQEGDGILLSSQKGMVVNSIIHDNYYTGIVADANENIIIGNRLYGNGIGISSMVNPNAKSVVIGNDFSGQPSPISGSVVGVVRNNIGYVSENGGKAVFNGDGTTTQFAIAHGLSKAPEHVVVTPGSADAMGDYYATTDSSSIYVNYAAAPPAGTNNVVLFWYAEV